MNCYFFVVFFLNCAAVAAPLQDCDRVEENVAPSEENAEDESRPAGDLPEGLQDAGERMEERSEEEIAPGTSPPQVPPKHLPQLSSGDGEDSSGTIRVRREQEEILKLIVRQYY